MTANRAASVRARLKQHTDTSKQDFNLTLTRYGLERLLYRLSISEHAPNFDYPTLLPHVPASTLRAYPKATVVAEKLHAVTVLGMTNTRMKDFFDLALLLRDDTLDDGELQQAVEATFSRRQTAVPSSLPIGLSNAFADDTTTQTQWRAFLNKNKLEPGPSQGDRSHPSACDAVRTSQAVGLTLDQPCARRCSTSQTLVRQARGRPSTTA